MAKKSKYVKLGALLTRKDGGYYIKLQDDVKITINGKAYNNGFINAEAPQDVLARLAENGFLTEDELEQRIEKVPDFVKLELTAVHKD